MTHFDPSHWMEMLSGAVALSMIGYAVRTFPRPSNVYLLWLYNVVQYAVANLDKTKDTGK